MKQIISYPKRLLLNLLDAFAVDLKDRSSWFGFVVMAYCLIAVVFLGFVVCVYCHLIPGIRGR